jgi:hypothetical protein
MLGLVITGLDYNALTAEQENQIKEAIIQGILTTYSRLDRVELNVTMQAPEWPWLGAKMVEETELEEPERSLSGRKPNSSIEVIVVINPLKTAFNITRAIQSSKSTLLGEIRAKVGALSGFPLSGGKITVVMDDAEVPPEPTAVPTSPPTRLPPAPPLPVTKNPTPVPTMAEPVELPSASPTGEPTTTNAPTALPTKTPTYEVVLKRPNPTPATAPPTPLPPGATFAPTSIPTLAPPTLPPTEAEDCDQEVVAEDNRQARVP